jgi:hypothetical protein
MHSRIKHQAVSFRQALHGLSWAFYSVGFFLAFSIIISGRKWEMSRFMILPYALGLIFFILPFALDPQAVWGLVRKCQTSYPYALFAV